MLASLIKVEVGGKVGKRAMMYRALITAQCTLVAEIINNLLIFKTVPEFEFNT